MECEAPKVPETRLLVASRRPRWPSGMAPTLRTTSRQRAYRLRNRPRNGTSPADTGKTALSVWLYDLRRYDLRRSWNEHLARVRDDIDRHLSEYDVDKAKRRVERAENDALLAMDFAHAASKRAEYAALDADLAKVEAERHRCALPRRPREAYGSGHRAGSAGRGRPPA